MPSFATQIKRDLFELAGGGRFIDPVTGASPTSERALSSLLGAYAQRQLVQWTGIPLYRPETRERAGDASTLISRPGMFVTEYLLLHGDLEQERIWGSMSADLLYLSNDRSTLVLFENKVGSDFTYEPNAATSQLARQLDYLRRAVIPPAGTRTLILVTAPAFVEHGWYFRELVEALDYDGRRNDVTGFIVYWEDIMQSIAV